jgi:D-sedoheptulose 7-phosphate isomerase
MDFGARTQTYFNDVKRALDRIPADVLSRIYETVLLAYEEDRQVFIIGNGGSAANASHAACDLGKGTAHPGRRRFRVVSLADNTPVSTAYANDLSYDQIFAEPIRTLAREGDLVIALSGSGNSPNVLEGVRAAREVGAHSVALTGYQGGGLKDLADETLIVPSSNMQHIEDCHLILCHIIYHGVRDHVAAGAVAGTSKGASR